MKTLIGEHSALLAARDAVFSGGALQDAKHYFKGNKRKDAAAKHEFLASRAYLDLQCDAVRDEIDKHKDPNSGLSLTLEFDETMQRAFVRDGACSELVQLVMHGLALRIWCLLVMTLEFDETMYVRDCSTC